MAISASLKPVLTIAAVIGLISMGACETGKGLSLSAADLTAGSTDNRAAITPEGLWTKMATVGQPSAASAAAPAQAPATTPTSNATLTSSAPAPVSDKSARTLASIVDSETSSASSATGMPVGDVLHMAGNAMLAFGDSNPAGTDGPMLDNGARVVSNVATAIGQALNTSATAAQTSGTIAAISQVTVPLSGAAQVTAAGQNVVGNSDADGAPLAVAALSPGPTSGSIAGVGLANSGAPASASLAGVSLVSTSIGNAANASNTTTSLIGLTAASATQTSGTLASVGVAGGNQLAWVAIGSTPVASAPVGGVAAVMGPATSTAIGSSTPPAANPISAVVAGNSSKILGSGPSSTAGSSLLVPAKYLAVKKIGQ